MMARNTNKSAAWGAMSVAALMLITAVATYLMSSSFGSVKVQSGGLYRATHGGCPPPSCLDALIVYHEDDATMLVKNGGLESALANLKGVRKFFILSESDNTFSHIDPKRVSWIDEKRAPFSKADFNGGKRPPGWLFQQALKFWAVNNVDEMCNDVLVLDSDILWVKPFDVLKPVDPPRWGWPADVCPPPPRIKYNLASMDSGAWYGDITNAEYHHYVNWLVGMPKVLADTHTAINNFQVMQKDVVARLEDSVKERGFRNIQEALMNYGKSYNGMSEYEAYFSFAWYNYRERIEPVYVPWILRKPETCDFNDKEMLEQFNKRSSVVYFTCHDNYGADDYYINCKNRGDCDPRRG